ncbi:hypothetical protein GJ496_005572 [Pomphorhynchus laevis]|nr:hypothetical protein GJ496_005572 [Pomphorhynchus laevis]
MVRPELDLLEMGLITPTDSKDIFHFIITWKTGKGIAKLTFKPTLLNICRFNNEVLKYTNTHMDNNEITIMNLNNMISKISSEFLFSKTKQHHSYFCSSLAKIKKAYLKASLNDDRELMKILSSNYWEVKTIQILSQQKKLIREAKSYSRQWWSIAHNATKRSWIYRAHKWLLTNGKQKIFEEIKVKHLKNARPTNEAFINRSSLIKNLSLNEEDFELNKYDLANAWPRLAKLSNDGSSPSAACLKLLNFESRIMKVFVMLCILGLRRHAEAIFPEMTLNFVRNQLIDDG